MRKTDLISKKIIRTRVRIAKAAAHMKHVDATEL
jgi:hypothetical protein